MPTLSPISLCPNQLALGTVHFCCQRLGLEPISNHSDVLYQSQPELSKENVCGAEDVRRVSQRLGIKNGGFANNLQRTASLCSPGKKWEAACGGGPPMVVFLNSL